MQRRWRGLGLRQESGRFIRTSSLSFPLQSVALGFGLTSPKGSLGSTIVRCQWRRFGTTRGLAALGVPPPPKMPFAQTSASSVIGVKDIPLHLDFPPPATNSSSALAFVNCPCCKKHLSLNDAELHMLKSHPEVSRSHVKLIVEQRKRLHEAAVKREKYGVSADASEVESISGGDGHRTVIRKSSSGGAAQAHSEDGVSQQGSQSPGAAASQGPHVCRYCNEPYRDPPSFQRFDDLARHICEVHPDVDLDAEIPPPAAPPHGRRVATPAVELDADGAPILTPQIRRFTMPEDRVLSSGKKLPFVPPPVTPAGGKKKEEEGFEIGIKVPLPPPAAPSAAAAAPKPAHPVAPHTVKHTTPIEVPGRKGTPIAVGRSPVDPIVAAPPPPPEPAPVEFSDDSFPCELCRKVFASEVDLLKHLEERHPDGVSTLDDSEIEPLGTDGSTVAGVEESTASAAPTRPKVTLKPCGLTPAAVSEAVSRYAPRVAGQIKVKCDLCPGQKVFTTEVALFAHIKQKHPEVDATKKVRSLIDGSNTASTETLALKCEFCNKVFASHSALHGHMSSKHGAQALAAAAKMHGEPPLEVQKEESAKKNPWWCNDCDKGFGSNKALLSHLSTKHGLVVPSIPCPSCKRVFPDIYSLKDHVALMHRNLDADSIEGDEVFSCEYCVRKFIHQERLDAHQQKYHYPQWKQKQREGGNSGPIVAEFIRGGQVMTASSAAAVPGKGEAGTSKGTTVQSADGGVEETGRAPGQPTPKLVGPNPTPSADPNKAEEIHPDEVLFA
jgi:hypothetical protein